MNRMSNPMRRAAGLLLGLATAATFARPSGESDVFAERAIPVYLLRDAGGRIYTFDPFPDATGAVSRLVARYVGPEEIEQLEEAGLEVRVEDADAFLRNAASLASLPPEFALVSINSKTYGTFYVEGEQPKGGGTHWVSFTFASLNMEPFHSHAALGLLFDTEQFTSSFPPSNLPAVVGNGIVLGNLSNSIGGCGQGENTDPVINMQVESYWHEGVPGTIGGNKLYPSTCYPWGIARQVFDVEVLADTDGNVSYGRTPARPGQARRWSSPVIDTSPDRPPGRPGTLSGGGIFFALVGNPNPTPSASILYFSDAQTGWH